MPNAASSQLTIIMALLAQGKIEQADHFYRQKKSDDLSFHLDAVLCHKDVLENNVLLFSSETKLINDLQEVACSDQKRVKILLACVPHSLATPTVAWWCEKFQALSRPDQEKLAQDLVEQGLLRQCCQHPTVNEHSNILVKTLPLFFWEKSLQSHPSTFHLWLQKQEEETVEFLVRNLHEKGLPLDHALFQVPLLQRLVLKQEINDAGFSPTKPQPSRKM